MRRRVSENRGRVSVGFLESERASERTRKSTWNRAGRGVASGKTRAAATLPTPNPRGSSLKAGGVSP